ncbi:hypothetical protein COB72_09470 [bacterium]|nr:MAG: hypothetical protein COB72_09470 [bacterium]
MYKRPFEAEVLAQHKQQTKAFHSPAKQREQLNQEQDKAHNRHPQVYMERVPDQNARDQYDRQTARFLPYAYHAYGASDHENCVQPLPHGEQWLKPQEPE